MKLTISVLEVVNIFKEINEQPEQLYEMSKADIREEHKIRSGIEAINSELKRKHDMDKVWTRGKERATFAVLMKVTACNIKRFMRSVHLPELWH